MTCSGASSLLLTRTRLLRGKEVLAADGARECGKGIVDRQFLRGMEWLGGHFRVTENFGSKRQWKFYHLDGLEHVGRLSGERLIGGHDWFREGAEELVRVQDEFSGGWEGALSRVKSWWRRVSPCYSWGGAGHRSSSRRPGTLRGTTGWSTRTTSATSCGPSRTTGSVR